MYGCLGILIQDNGMVSDFFYQLKGYNNSLTDMKLESDDHNFEINRLMDESHISL